MLYEIKFYVTSAFAAALALLDFKRVQFFIIKMYFPASKFVGMTNFFLIVNNFV
jgi:hypothetical protein